MKLLLKESQIYNLQIHSSVHLVSLNVDLLYMFICAPDGHFIRYIFALEDPTGFSSRPHADACVELHRVILTTSACLNAAM